MQNQIVKAYYFIARSNCNTLEDQINADLEKHPNWTIHLLSPHLEADMCYVVYNIDDSLERLANRCKEEAKPADQTPLFGPNSPSINFANAGYNDHCKDCWFYRQYLSEGKLYIGDSPCQWCQHYPWKVTYGTGSKPE